MQQLPSASVVVPVLNGEATIGDMLRAITTATPRPSELEIIVVDNGSTDSTRDIVAGYDGVTLLTAARRGAAAARNVGLRAATGEVILHCDADTLPTRRWIAELASCFDDPQVVLAAGRTLNFPPTTPAERYLAGFQLYDAEVNISRPVLPFAASMNMAVRRSAALAIGGWNEDMMTSEDVDFCTRLLARYPAPIAYAPLAVLFHRNRSSDFALKKQAWSYGEGVADTYRRYPDAVPWGGVQYVHLARNLAARTLAPLWWRARSAFGGNGESEAERASYHRMWTWWFWRGFFSFQRSGKYRTEWTTPTQAR
jgi:glycosyltransferase involved in cell wall biosynthesis